MRPNYIKQLVLITCVFISIGGFAQKKQIKNTTKNAQSKINYTVTEENKKAFQETGYVRCLTVENEIALQKEYPNRYTNDEFEKWLSPKTTELKSKRLSGKNQKTTIIYNIPVVIHIIHNGDAINTIGNIVGENISDAQAASQIEIMNQDFRRMNNTPGGANTTGLAVDVEINFCLATQDENGLPTSGIIRHNITPYSNNVADGAGGADWETRSDVELMKATTQWDPTKYLNMWTFRAGGEDLDNGGLNGLLGYAQFPSASGLDGLATNGGSASTDGVVASFDAFGSIAYSDNSFNLNQTYNLGRTMTHEVGHWLGLRHIWGDGDCTVDDYCDDTPNAGQANYVCSVVNSCTDRPASSDKNDMIENYMDYTTDDCMDTFTQDQKDRMIAVMENSPRRVELNSSKGCVQPTPAIYFNNSGSSILEGTSCGYTDIPVELAIAKAPSEDAIITFANTSGTVTEGIDFDFVNNSVTFLAGQTESKTLTIRIYEDSFDETDETLIIGMSLSTTGDAEITTIGNSETEIIITNDDSREVNLISLFTENFESYTDFTITEIGDWSMYDGDGNSTYGNENVDFTNEGYTGTFIIYNAAQTTPSSVSGWQSHGGDKGYYCFAATSSPNGTALNNDYIFSPQINLNGLNSQLRFWAKSITDEWGLERFSVKISTTDTSISSFTTIYPTNPIPGGNIYEEAPIDWTEYTYDLSSFDGQQIYIAFHVVSNDAYAFMLDDVSVTKFEYNVQLEVNSPDQNALNSAGTIFVNNDVNKNLVVDIINNDGKNYGCVDAFVSRAFDANNPAVQQQASGNSNYVLAKKFTITPETIQSAGDASVKFYFTEEEISAWETATGNNRSSLTVYKDNGTTIETAIATVGSFNTAITLSANFSTGLNGTYFFGSTTVLNVDKSEFHLFTVYPNPVSNELNIALSSSSNIDVSLFDMIGKEIYKASFTNNTSPFIRKIPISFAKGIYVLKVESDGKIATKKIIIK